jgi:hypothetical protein
MRQNKLVKTQGSNMNSAKYLLVMGCISIISACGGGSSSPTPPSNTPSQPSSDIQPKRMVSGINFYHADNFYQGQGASFAVTLNTNVELNDTKWIQTSGTPLTFLAQHTQVIGFDIKQTGDYQIEFQGTTSSGQTINERFDFTATTTSSDAASIRLDHSVSEQGKVSLRVAGASNKIVSSITWEQLDGPDIAKLESQNNDVFFDAPTVSKDEIIQIKATIRYSDNSTASDTSLLVVKNVDINQDGYFPKFAEDIVSTDVYPFIQDSPHSENLSRCVYNNQIASSCTFSDLPLIGQEFTDPTIDQIMQRLVVSHEWMGQRFRQFLEQSTTAQDMLKLLRATTAIVISYDVRPSFYWTATGAIYLDAANFWMTPEERDTLNTQPDYRSDFGNDLQFIIPWRYVKDNDYYFRNSDYPAQSRLTNSFRALEANITWLMYHELAHANDFFPPSSWLSINLQSSPLSYSSLFDASSDTFSQTYELTSETMKSLAKVSFAGETASTAQKALLAEDVASHFKPDAAPAYYSYSTIREDYATLFERFMMSYRLGVSADVAVISDVNNEDLIVTWGQRDRFNDIHIQHRVQSVVQDILPELDVAAIQPTLPAPKLMRENQGWLNNIDLSEMALSPRNKTPNKKIEPVSPVDYWHIYRHGPKSP